MIRRSSSCITILVVISLSITHQVARARPEHIQQDDARQEKTSSSNNHKHLSPALQIHKLGSSSNNITCNDGSQIGYYKRLNSRSKSWIIYLQGGGFCGSEESCQQRWLTNPELMSSNFWPKTKIVGGILSNDPKDNPHLWNVNHIYVPYCSSDSWSGLSIAGSKSSNSQFSFMGSMILERVFDSLFDDLPEELSLHEAKSILLVGDSAGATGVIINLDKVREVIQKRYNTRATKTSCSDHEQTAAGVSCSTGIREPPVLKGLADSGWFLDNEPYDSGSAGAMVGGIGEISSIDCDRSKCSPSQSIKQAMIMWNGQLPSSCTHQYRTEPWRCYFGYRAYQTLKTPLFVVQWLYDEAQLLVDNIARPETSGQWSYVRRLVKEMKASLQNVTALFAPSCFSHSLIVKRTWNQININGFKLPYVLNEWQQPASEPDTPISQRRIAIKSDYSSDSVALNLEHNLTTRQAQISAIKLNQTNTAAHRLLQDSMLQNQEQPDAPSFSASNSRDSELSPLVIDQRVAQPKLTLRNRTRKRKRNNQQHRSKARQRASQNGFDSYPVTLSESNNPMQKEYNDLASLSNVHQEPTNVDKSVQDCTQGRMFRSPAGSSVDTSIDSARSGRSASIDDAAHMISNSVPTEFKSNAYAMQSSERDRSKNSLRSGSNLSPQVYPSSFDGDANSFPNLNKYLNVNQFRFIDSCGWPQCNKDCPVLDIDLLI